jgi:eukaryotic-like serine/threonine-protein kinase
MAAAPYPHRDDHQSVIRFGVFELDKRSLELRRQGIRVRVQTKPLQILLALLEQPGTVITRDELRKRLWSEDTFVDFERGLNSATNRLRSTLNDSAENPRFIETVGGVGYRFIAPVNGPAAETVRETVIETKVAARRSWIWPAVITGVLAAAVAAAVMWIATKPTAPELRFTSLTFGYGQVLSAAFLGSSEVAYSARWGDSRAKLFVTSFSSPESRALGIEGMTLASVSRTGELALLQGGLTSNITGSVLYRVPVNGGSPLRTDENIMSADWSPDGRSLAVVRAIQGSNQVEYPAGRVLHKTAGWLSDVRVSPDGSTVAFIEHPARHDDSGDVRVATGTDVRTLSSGWGDIDGLEWHESGDEVWFTASKSGGPSTLWASKLRSGAVRAVTNFPMPVALADRVHEHGAARMLFVSKVRRLEMAGQLKGDTRERKLTWLDWSRVVSISADGGTVLFDESGEAVGTRPVVYVYRAENDSTVRLGDGLAQGIMPDGRSALVLDATDRRRLRIVPLAGGGGREIAAGKLRYQWVRPMPDGKRATALATDSGGALALWVIGLDGSVAPVMIADSIMVRNSAISPDGSQVAVLVPDGRLRLFSTTERGRAVDIPVSARRLAPLHWSRDGEWLFVQHLDTVLPATVSKIHIATGEVRPWKQILPADRAGVNSVTGIVISADEEHYAYSSRRTLGSLFAAEPR